MVKLSKKQIEEKFKSIAQEFIKDLDEKDLMNYNIAKEYSDIIRKYYNEYLKNMFDTNVKYKTLIEMKIDDHIVSLYYYNHPKYNSYVWDKYLEFVLWTKDIEYQMGFGISLNVESDEK